MAQGVFVAVEPEVGELGVDRTAPTESRGHDPDRLSVHLAGDGGAELDPGAGSAVVRGEEPDDVGAVDGFEEGGRRGPALRAALLPLLPDIPLKRTGHDEERYLFAQLLTAAPSVTSTEAPVATPIIISGLSDGPHTLRVRVRLERWDAFRSRADDMDWDKVKEFTENVAKSIAHEHPDRYTPVMTKTKRTSPIFTVPSLPAHYVNRPREFEAVAQLLLEGSSSPVAITTALQGGGGFGKTTLALALCPGAERGPGVAVRRDRVGRERLAARALRGGPGRAGRCDRLRLFFHRWQL